MLKKSCSKINGQAFKDEIYNAGYKYSMIQNKFDLPMSLSNRVRDGWLENWLIKLLENELKIDPNKYVIKDEPKQMTIEDIPITPPFDYEKLYQTIKKAVIDAYYTVNDCEVEK